jgi:RimJ/RimL family protein N-acetyltransferase
MPTSFILPLETERLVVRNWRDADRALFHEVNSDDAVMEYFAIRRDRAQSDEMLDVLAAGIERVGFGFSALERKSDGACLGFCGIAPLEMHPWFPAGTVEIGWRIARRYWGNGYVTEGARALLAAGFTDLDLHEVVAIAVPENRRSTAVMDRLGMVRDLRGDFDHPKVPDTHPALKRHGTWRITKARWLAGAGS